MKKSELLNLVSSLENDDNVLEILKNNEQLKSLQEVNFDSVKSYLENKEDGKMYLQKFADSKVTAGIKTWKDNNLQKLIDKAVLDATGKNKEPWQIEMDKMKAEMEQEKAKNAKILRESKAKDLLTAKGLKIELLPYINLGEDDEAMTNTINNLSVFVNDIVSDQVKTVMASGSYTPPGGDDEMETVSAQLAQIFGN
jgi:hypothetical protein|nr:MAG TPA: Major head protein [Caudoviricetes sp.]